MAVANTKSTVLTNIEADPRVLNNIKYYGGRQRIIKDYVSVAAADDDTSTYRLCRVLSHWVLHSIRVRCTAITGGTDYDCGLYSIDDGAAVDADLYADGFTVATACPAVPHAAASASFLELRFGDASTAVLTDINNQVWEDVGLSEDSGLAYDLVLTANTVGTAAGTIAFEVHYSAGD